MQPLPLPGRQRVVFDPLAGGVHRARKEPPFRDDYEHASYILEHPDGLLLFDAPPLCTDEAIAFVKRLGTPRWLVGSHTDCVGAAARGADARGVPALMGAGDQPLDGNRFVPAERIAAPRALASGLHLVPVPCDSP